MIMICCPNTKLKDICLRLNPATGDKLLLCPRHADYHDEGRSFKVIPHPYPNGISKALDL